MLQNARERHPCLYMVQTPMGQNGAKMANAIVAVRLVLIAMAYVRKQTAKDTDCINMKLKVITFTYINKNNDNNNNNNNIITLGNIRELGHTL